MSDTITLPGAIVRFIEQDTTSTQKKYYTRLVTYIMSKAHYHRRSALSWIPISKTHFRKQVGSRYRQYLTDLERAGIVQTDGSYYAAAHKANSKCLRWRITGDYLDNPVIIMNTLKQSPQRPATGFIQRRTAQVLMRLHLPHTDHDHLIRFVNDKVDKQFILSQCSFNEKIAEGYYKLNGSGKTFALSYLLREAESRGVDVILYRNQIYLQCRNEFIPARVAIVRNRYLQEAVKLSELYKGKKLFVSRNDTNRRLDTNITNAPSVLTSHLQLDGEKLVEIDLKVSQPTLLINLFYEISMDVRADLLNNYFKNEPGIQLAVENLRKRRKGKIRAFLLKFPDLYNLCYLNVARFYKSETPDYYLSASLPYDCERFIQLVKEGDFYIQMSNDLNTGFDFTTINRQIQNTSDISYGGVTVAGIRQQGSSWEITGSRAEQQRHYNDLRKTIKQFVFVMLFSSWKYQGRNKKVLKNAYPTLVSFCDYYKKQVAGYQKDNRPVQNSILNNGKASASLAILLQRLESHIFIDYVLKGLLKQNIPALSKHDSILIPQSYEKVAENYIQSILDSFLYFYQLSQSVPESSGHAVRPVASQNKVFRQLQNSTR